jgi:hypothetical protein
VGVSLPLTFIALLVVLSTAGFCIYKVRQNDMSDDFELVSLRDDDDVDDLQMSDGDVGGQTSRSFGRFYDEEVGREDDYNESKASQGKKKKTKAKAKPASSSSEESESETGSESGSGSGSESVQENSDHLLDLDMGLDDDDSANGLTPKEMREIQDLEESMSPREKRKRQKQRGGKAD